jgi:hypothetical protein
MNWRCGVRCLVFLLVLVETPHAYGQSGRPLVTVVDDLAPVSWSNSRGSYCPAGWTHIDGMPLCKHVATFDRFSPNDQRVLEDVRVVTVGLACPQEYQKLGETICARFVTLSTSDVYILTADVSYAGVYESDRESPRCHPGWDLVSHPYQGGIAMCLQKITILVRAAPR